MDSKVLYRQKMSYCGNTRCHKCYNGVGHGPYWYAYQMVNGHMKRTYMGKELPPEAAHFIGTEVTPRDFTDTFTYPDSLPTGRIPHTPLIGREKEYTFLSSLLHKIECNSSAMYKPFTSLSLDTKRRSQCVVLLGEAGIGKTRLAEEVGYEARQRGWAVLWSRAHSQESGIPYHIWSDILRKAFEVDNAQLIPPELWVSQRASAPVVSMELAQEQLRLREAACTLLTTSSRKKPLLIVLDDLQWADGSSCELLGHLARHVHGVPILLLATCRSHEAQKTLHKIIASMDNEHTITLLPVEPLARDEIAHLVEYLPSRHFHCIQSQAAGNPFFAEELARSMHLSQVPRTISAALDAHMNTLSKKCRTLLKNAAVLGSSFTFPLIRALEAKQVKENTDEDALFDLLEEAIAADVLIEEGVGVYVTYSFWHPLMMTYLYESVSVVQRKHIHRRVADVLLRMHSGHEIEVAATIAHHLLYGGAEPIHVAHYAEMAGDHAYTLLAYTEAERYYRIALDATKSDYLGWMDASLAGPLLAPEHIAPLTERLAESVMAHGRFAEARVLFERVLDFHFKMLRDDPLYANEAQVQALLWSEVGHAWFHIGDAAKALQYYERSEQVLRQAYVRTGFAYARLRMLQGHLLAQEGSYSEAVCVVKEALHLFQEAFAQHRGLPLDPHVLVPLSQSQRILRGDLADLGRIYILLGSVHNSIGQLNNALAYLTTAFTMFEQRNQKREIANACCIIGSISLKKAEFVVAQNALDRSLAIIKDIGDSSITSIVLSNCGELAACRGDMTEAETQYKRALSLSEHLRDRTSISLCNARLAVILQAQQKFVEANVCSIRALRVGRTLQNNLCIANALLALATMRIAQAQVSYTMSHKQRLLTHAQRNAQRALILPKLDAETYTHGKLIAAHVLLLLGDTVQARKWLEDVIEQAHRYTLVLIEQQARQMQDALLASSLDTIHRSLHVFVP